MKYKTYRICLLSLVILAVVGGIFYYRNMEENQAQTVDGTFVEAFPEQEQKYMTAMEIFGSGADEYLAKRMAEREPSDEIMDAFCRKVASWEERADGEAYGSR